MAENSKIQWCTHTMNFWTGCQKVSSACDLCYAETWAKRAGRDFNVRIRTTPDNWKKPFRWHQDSKETSREQVFTNSLADFFDNQVDQKWRDDAYDVIAQCSGLDWLILTKRPQNIPRMAPPEMLHWPRHVWIGASAGTRVEFDRNVRHLREIAPKVRFLSLEPLLEDLGQIDLAGIHWVIVGGESGGKNKARACWVPSVRSIVRQCNRQKVPVFVKQLGSNVQDRNDAGFDGCEPDSWPDMDPFDIEHDLDGTLDGYQGAPVRVHLKDKKGGDMSEWPSDLRVREMPNV